MAAVSVFLWSHFMCSLLQRGGNVLGFTQVLHLHRTVGLFKQYFLWVIFLLMGYNMEIVKDFYRKVQVVLKFTLKIHFLLNWLQVWLNWLRHLCRRVASLESGSVQCFHLRNRVKILSCYVIHQNKRCCLHCLPFNQLVQRSCWPQQIGSVNKKVSS